MSGKPNVIGIDWRLPVALSGASSLGAREFTVE